MYLSIVPLEAGLTCYSFSGSNATLLETQQVGVHFVTRVLECVILVLGAETGLAWCVSSSVALLPENE